MYNVNPVNEDQITIKTKSKIKINPVIKKIILSKQRHV